VRVGKGVGEKAKRIKKKAKVKKIKTARVKNTERVNKGVEEDKEDKK
jgi:hypothetical protein